MTRTERTELLKRAIRTYGESAQVDMAIEEMSELTKALCKVKRAHGGPETMATISNVIEEIADVQIMLDQLRIIFGGSADAEEVKLERLSGRLDRATASCWWVRSCNPRPLPWEGRAWHGEAQKQGAELRAKMRPGKVYLYQLFTTIFVEFPDMAAAKAFRKAMSERSPGWDVDAVAVIDTSDPEQAEKWAVHMEGGEIHG